MKKILFFIFGLIILISINGHSFAQEKDMPCYPDYTKSSINPSYSLVVRSDKTEINPGEIVKIEIFISGLGSIKEDSKLFIVFPTEFVDEKHEYYGVILLPNIAPNVSLSMFNLSNNELAQELSKLNLSVNAFFPLQEYLDKEAMVFGIPPDFFRQFPPRWDNCSSLSVLTETTYPESKSKKVFNESALITILFKTSNKAYPGDSKINFVLTYTNGLNWYQDEEEVIIHVKNPIEENYNELFLYLAFIAIVLAGVSDYTKRVIQTLTKNKLGQVIIFLFILILIRILYLAGKTLLT